LNAREVSVVGAGMVPFRRDPAVSIESMAENAVATALADSGLDRTRIQAGYCGTVFGPMGTGQRSLRSLGMTGIPVLNIENACSSGSSAFREAYLAISSGLYDVAIAFGVEKLSSLGGGTLPLGEDIETAQGVTMPGIYAMRAKRHMHDYGTSIEQLAKIAVKNHRNSVANPMAQYRREYSLEEVLGSRPVADPLTLLHCCPTGDGAAATVLMATEHVTPAQSPVKVRASVLTSGTFKTGFRDMTRSELTIEAARRAYEAAGLGPADIDVAEVHDAFTIGELMYYEALGFCQPGEGGRLIDAGATEIGGSIPVNPSGGLLSKGHPLGATGVAQIVEVVEQLRGRCGPRQVTGPRLGLTHCTGGGVSGFDHIACTVTILEQERGDS
jgi:acetyl-CoA acetyltransferase